MTITEERLQEVLQELAAMPEIHSGDVPDIDLYMDQVTTFMEDRLGSVKRDPDEKILTKTMINNYAKNKLLPPPEKKKYSREHILILIYIYYLKNVLSLQDIQSMLNPAAEKYFHANEGLSFTDLYDEIFSDRAFLSDIVQTDIQKYRQQAVSKFQDAPEADRDSLQAFDLLCSLSFDIYIRKKALEKLLDAAAPPVPSGKGHGKADAAKSKKEKGS